MTEQEHIEQAHGSLLETLFRNFSLDLAEAKNNAPAVAAAKDKFLGHVARARTVRDTALSLL